MCRSKYFCAFRVWAIILRSFLESFLHAFRIYEECNMCTFEFCRICSSVNSNDSEKNWIMSVFHVTFTCVPELNSWNLMYTFMEQYNSAHGVRYLGFSKVSNIFERFQAGYLELFFLSIKSLNLYLIQKQISKIVEHQSKIKKALSRLPNERINFCPMLVLSQARVMFYGDKISNENLSSKLKLFLFLNKLVCMRQAHA